jgi:hypothetical protein
MVAGLPARQDRSMFTNRVMPVSTHARGKRSALYRGRDGAYREPAIPSASQLLPVAAASAASSPGRRKV